MAREQQQGARGRFLLGGSYGEPGPGLGTLYEAWRMEDGRPVLLLRPGGDVEWRPEGPWRVCLSCDPTRDDAVALDVEHSPRDAPLSELANLLVLMSASVERVEDVRGQPVALVLVVLGRAAVRAGRAREGEVVRRVRGADVLERRDLVVVVEPGRVRAVDFEGTVAGPGERVRHGFGFFAFSFAVAAAAGEGRGDVVLEAHVLGEGVGTGEGFVAF